MKIYLLIDGQVCNVTWFQHHKPGKGGAFMKVKAKNIISGKTIEKTFRADEKVTQAIVENRKVQYLYREGDMYVMMDIEDYSQMYVPVARLGERGNFLIEGNEVDLVMYNNEILDIEMPPQVRMKVVKADPGIKGNTATGATKKVRLETGHEIDVPLFINENDSVIVDTRSGEYVSRADQD
ncbi:MAG: elongation factor P [Elusimicrobiota bacterium]